MIYRIIDTDPTEIQLGISDINHNKINNKDLYGLLKRSDDDDDLHIYSHNIGLPVQPSGVIIFIPLKSNFEVSYIDTFHDEIFNKKENRKRLKITVK